MGPTQAKEINKGTTMTGLVIDKLSMRFDLPGAAPFRRCKMSAWT